jgi:hypothetical protein
MKPSLIDKLLFILVLIISFSACKSVKSNNEMKKLKDIEEFSYKFGDSSVPPPYHRSYSIVMDADSIKLTVDSYGDILAKETYAMPKGGLQKIGEAIVKYRIDVQKDKKQDGGCTGGTTRHISYSCKGEKEKFSASALYCGGDLFGTLSGDLDSFFMELKTFVPDLNDVIRSTK